MSEKRASKDKTKSITRRIRAITLLVNSVLAVFLIFIMTFFMNSLTDSILIETLQPMAKTAAQSIEGNLHTLVERFLLLRDRTTINSSSATAEEKSKILKDMASGVEFVWVGLYLPDGTLCAGTDEAPDNVSGRELFTSIKTAGNLVIQDTSIGSMGPEITMGVPVNPDGVEDAEPIYYLVGGYDYEIIGDVLRKINISPNGMAFIVNDDGVLIAHETLEKVFRRESVSDSLGTGADAEAAFLAMTERQTGTMDVDTQQGRTFVSFSPIRGTMWSLGIQAPRSDYISATNQALTIAVLITILILVGFSLFLTFFIRKTLSVPLKTITNSADKLAAGEFESLIYPNALERQDEIGRLGEAFLSVSHSVQDLVRDLTCLTDGARSGKLDQRSDATAYSGDYRNILSGINATLDVFCSHLDLMPVAVMFLDESRQNIYHNKAMSEFLDRHGLPESNPQILSALMPDFASGGLPPEVEAVFFSRGAEDSFQMDVGLKDIESGEARHYGFGLWRVKGDSDTATNDADKSVCVMLILNDITQITKAKTDAEAANRSKSEFLARMSHEMRTPMNAIIGMTTIGKSTEEAARKEYSLTRIEEAAQHLLGIINDILDMSKIEADKLELSYAESAFEPMIQRVVHVINVRAQEKNQNLIVNIGKDIPSQIITDEQRLAQVITNLLSNAVKFTPDGGTITLRAEKTAETADTCTLQVEVKDTGIGISEEQQQRLFAAFEQADGSISRRFGGTGLGLVISKQIIDLMGGRIWIESEVDKGTSFFVEIELQKSKPDAAEEDSESQDKDADSALPEAANTEGIFDGKLILVAEDVDINREILEALLAPTGIKIEFAFDGVEAVEKSAANDQYHLILMDIHMPNVDGFEATRRIRASGLPTATIPIIAMTANVFREDVEKCLAVGMNGHLGKPLDIDKVIATLANYLT